MRISMHIGLYLFLSVCMILIACASPAATLPPVIQKYEIPKWVVEGENIELTVFTSPVGDVKEVYVQFINGIKADLSTSRGGPNQAGLSEWKAIITLPPNNYDYTIVAKSATSQSTASDKLIVYSNDADGDGISYRDELKYGLDPNKKNPVAAYLIDKGLGFYISDFARFEADGILGENEKSFIDLVAKYHPYISQVFPTFYSEVLKLPEVSDISKENIVVLDKLLKLASDPQYKPAFGLMLKEGILDKRKYCTPLDMLWYYANSEQTDIDSILTNYSIANLWTRLKKTSVWDTYKAKHLTKFDDAIVTLNSPYLAYWWIKDTVRYQWDIGPGYWFTAEQLFNRPVGDCEDYATFVTFCLYKNGYSREFDTVPNNSACSLILAIPKAAQDQGCAMGHAVPIVKIDGKIYCYDAVPEMKGITGPYNTIIDVANDVLPGWTAYTIAGDQPWDDKQELYSKPFKDWIWRQK